MKMATANTSRSDDEDTRQTHPCGRPAPPVAASPSP